MRQERIAVADLTPRDFHQLVSKLRDELVHLHRRSGGGGIAATLELANREGRLGECPPDLFAQVRSMVAELKKNDPDCIEGKVLKNFPVEPIGQSNGKLTADRVNSVLVELTLRGTKVTIEKSAGIDRTLVVFLMIHRLYRRNKFVGHVDRILDLRNQVEVKRLAEFILGDVHPKHIKEPKYNTARITITENVDKYFVFILLVFRQLYIVLSEAAEKCELPRENFIWAMRRVMMKLEDQGLCGLADVNKASFDRLLSEMVERDRERLQRLAELEYRKEAQETQKSLKSNLKGKAK